MAILITDDINANLGKLEHGIGLRHDTVFSLLAVGSVLVLSTLGLIQKSSIFKRVSKFNRSTTKEVGFCWIMTISAPQASTTPSVTHRSNPPKWLRIQNFNCPVLLIPTFLSFEVCGNFSQIETLHGIFFILCSYIDQMAALASQKTLYVVTVLWYLSLQYSSCLTWLSLRQR